MGTVLNAPLCINSLGVKGRFAHPLPAPRLLRAPSGFGSTLPALYAPSAEETAMFVINRHVHAWVSYRMLKKLFQFSNGGFSGWAASPSAIMVTIPMKPFTIVWVNDAFSNLYGYNLQDIQGCTSDILLSPPAGANPNGALGWLEAAPHNCFISEMQNVEFAGSLQRMPLMTTLVHYTRGNEQIVVDTIASECDLFPMGLKTPTAPHLRDLTQSVLLFYFTKQS